MNVITVTDAARQYISERCTNDQIMLVKVDNKGCSGHSYNYSLVSTDSLTKLDEVILWENGGMAIENASVMLLFGSTLDLTSTQLEKYLTWSNPMADNYCGCGTSFSIKAD